MKKLLKKRLNQKGLTLIELLAVIVILAIVAAIAIPAISGLISNQRDKAVLADASSIISAAKLADAAGACDLTSPATGKECNQENENFKSYVGNVQGGVASGSTTATEATYNVYTGTGTQGIIVVYNAFGKINNSDYKPTTAGQMTESELNTKMNN